MLLLMGGDVLLDCLWRFVICLSLEKRALRPFAEICYLFGLREAVSTTVC
mgnify:CR=1 FL=1